MVDALIVASRSLRAYRSARLIRTVADFRVAQFQPTFLDHRGKQARLQFSRRRDPQVVQFRRPRASGHRKLVFNGFSLSLDVANEAEARRLFSALADGGTAQMPLAKTFWSPRFGMVADRFGVRWRVSVPGM